MPKKRTPKKVGKVFTNHKRQTTSQFRTISLRTKLLLSLGSLLLIIPVCFYANESIQLAFFTPHVTKIVATYIARPTHISIPAIQIELPVFETALSGNIWEIANNGISHLAISARPGQNGPIILYGHNTNDRFGPIRWLTKGSEIALTTDDGKVHRYRVYKMGEVDANETSALVNVKGETLILYTCDGFADLKRFLVFATPIVT